MYVGNNWKMYHTICCVGKLKVDAGTRSRDGGAEQVRRNYKFLTPGQRGRSLALTDPVPLFLNPALDPCPIGTLSLTLLGGSCASKPKGVLWIIFGFEGYLPRACRPAAERVAQCGHLPLHGDGGTSSSNES